MDDLTQRTLELRAAIASGGQLTKAGINVATGLVGYSLEAPAQLVYAIPTPLRNEIPRVGSTTPQVGTAAHWKQISAINSTNLNVGVGEGRRGAVLSVTERDQIAAFKTLGIENLVTFEAESGAGGFDDVRADAAIINLQALMLQEENVDLNGNTSLALGVTPTPTVVPSGGGALSVGTTNNVYCVALTQDGYLSATLASGVPGTISRVNADGTTDTYGAGSAQISATSAAFTTSGGTQTVTATVVAVPGAFAYAWYITAASTAVTAYLAAITTINKAVITANPSAARQAANAAVLQADNSRNALVYDGLIAQTINGAGYFASLDGATLTSTNQGEIAEIEAALLYFWNNYRATPDRIMVGAQVLQDMVRKILTTTGSLAAYRIDMAPDAQGRIKGGFRVGSYLNKYGLGTATGDLELMLHPNMPSNAIYFDLVKTPGAYMSSRVPGPRRIKAQREYHQIDWPLVTRSWPMGIYTQQVLQTYLPFLQGVIANIAPG